MITAHIAMGYNLTTLLIKKTLGWIRSNDIGIKNPLIKKKHATPYSPKQYPNALFIGKSFGAMYDRKSNLNKESKSCSLIL